MFYLIIIIVDLVETVAPKAIVPVILFFFFVFQMVKKALSILG